MEQLPSTDIKYFITVAENKVFWFKLIYSSISLFIINDIFINKRVIYGLLKVKNSYETTNQTQNYHIMKRSHFQNISLVANRISPKINKSKTSRKGNSTWLMTNVFEIILE